MPMIIKKAMSNNTKYTVQKCIFFYDHSKYHYKTFHFHQYFHYILQLNYQLDFSTFTIFVV